MDVFAHYEISKLIMDTSDIFDLHLRLVTSQDERFKNIFFVIYIYQEILLTPPEGYPVS